MQPKLSLTTGRKLKWPAPLFALLLLATTAPAAEFLRIRIGQAWSLAGNVARRGLGVLRNLAQTFPPVGGGASILRLPL